jgi:hypothetical protein
MDLAIMSASVLPYGELGEDPDLGSTVLGVDNVAREGLLDGSA